MRKEFFSVGLSVILLLLGQSIVFGQNKDAQNSNLYKHYQMKYVFGMKYNDSDVAKDALYSMIALDPTDDSLRFQLCYFYFENRKYPSSLFCSADILARDPDNIDALKINAMSYEQMGVRDKALSSYESLYLKTNDLGVLYQVAVLQLDLKRFTECKTNLDIISKSPKAKEVKLFFQKGQNEQQEISLEAAAYNLRGMVEKEDGNKTEAKKYYDMALKLYPEFEIAKQNIEELNK